MVGLQPVLRSKMNAVVLDQGFEQRAVEHQPGRPVHKDTGMLGWQACTLFALVYEASADGEAAV